MDLASMLEREDFFELFFQTVEHYYDEALKKEISISFAGKGKKCNLVIKPFLSAATARRMSIKARSFFYSEWNVRNSLWKYCAAKLYVFVLTRTGKIFAQYKFHMEPESAVSKDLVIAPNNRSIRIFDYGTGTVGCIAKKGFTDKFFSNQIIFRKTYRYDFMVPLLDNGTRWFIEPILSGHPLARVTDDTIYDKGVHDALAGIKLLAQDTMEYITSKEYADLLMNQINDMLQNAIKNKKIRYAEEIKQISLDASVALRQSELQIPICVSHGDFQSGNIWVDIEEKTWLYDWETVGKRSIWYDSSVLQYSLRRPYGWKNLLSDAEPKKMLHCDLKQERSVQEYEVIKKTVLLEDIIFYLEDMLELPKDWGNEIFDAFAERMSTLLINKK